TLERLCMEPMLVREIGSGTREVFEEALRERGLTVRPAAMVLGNTEAIKRAVGEGVGIAVVSRLTVQSEVRDNRLVVLDVPDFTLRRPLHRLQVRDRSSPASVQAFLKRFLTKISAVQ
ncbi:MAG: LysR substrate-binding domain-containing protein, partial [Armatimonadota bacterium]